MLSAAVKFEVRVKFFAASDASHVRELPLVRAVELVPPMFSEK